MVGKLCKYLLEVLTPEARAEPPRTGGESGVGGIAKRGWLITWRVRGGQAWGTVGLG